LQAFNGGLALFRNVADDVCDGIRLVLKMTVCHVGECLCRNAPARESEVLHEASIGLIRAFF
jgi:hypothetical protein